MLTVLIVGLSVYVLLMLTALFLYTNHKKKLEIAKQKEIAAKKEEERLAEIERQKRLAEERKRLEEKRAEERRIAEAKLAEERAKAKEDYLTRKKERYLNYANIEMPSSYRIIRLIDVAGMNDLFAEVEDLINKDRVICKISKEDFDAFSGMIRISHDSVLDY